MKRFRLVSIPSLTNGVALLTTPARSIYYKPKYFATSFYALIKTYGEFFHAVHEHLAKYNYNIRIINMLSIYATISIH